MEYSPDNAKWQDHGWENNVFAFSFGDFSDTDGDEFYFLVEYQKVSDSFTFFMEYEHEELVYKSDDAQISEFFERHMSKESMRLIEDYMHKLMR